MRKQVRICQNSMTNQEKKIIFSEVLGTYGDAEKDEEGIIPNQN